MQHEYAHQIDFFALDATDRKKLRAKIGGADWCYETPGVRHDDHGCERFATMVAWAYWRSSDNVQEPGWAGAQTKPRAFRRLLARLLAS